MKAMAPRHQIFVEDSSKGKGQARTEQFPCGTVVHRPGRGRIALAAAA
jgi:hypothetical protein